jgi:hypothetical protein
LPTGDGRRLFNPSRPLATGMESVASSAFPGAFQDVTLQWYMTPPQYLHLYDGGPIDNLGLQAILEYLNRNVPGTSSTGCFQRDA